ncbi:Schizosaccharomyces specific protein [Schizosaccharomyces pombe]|uniref:Uncharacterized protein C645.12c n=1 Tax=Schizosaccharomyces pombe (strain 972 / ATCC 24843) TaxID=284812 RepID=YCHC_SCHPO|nr:uncharacterized protein SPCC645.12c [Schizosaccharomyces pombe]Q9Y7V1.1 RecName: Full=Uncharacterized protein C645.12c [Schizosaccharomyces pombe 972h-]CAB39908.1 sequence orphan [Schizosaccharomyces pombe]|eukprot:NP_588121.1 uncharacterized protein SPCC645.12c [Schizosaccharomyces pombe]
MSSARELLRKVKQERLGQKRGLKASSQELKRQKTRDHKSFENLGRDQSRELAVSDFNEKQSTEPPKDTRAVSALPENFFDESIAKNKELIEEEWNDFQNEIGIIEENAVEQEITLQQQQLLAEKDEENEIADNDLEPEVYDILYEEESKLGESRDLIRRLKQKRFETKKNNFSVKESSNLSNNDSDASLDEDTLLWGL